jgi:hypothetical protein
MPGVALAFFWGLAEGTFFFVVPDVLISLIAIMKPARAWRHVSAAIAAALLAGMMLYSISARDHNRAEDFVTHVPFVQTKMLENVQSSYEKHGVGAIFLGPLTGTPYKIYAVEAPNFISQGSFLWATVPARAERFLFVWIVSGVVGSLLRKRFRRPDRQLIIGLGCFWVSFYAFYWGRIVLQ